MKTIFIALLLASSIAFARPEDGNYLRQLRGFAAYAVSSLDQDPYLMMPGALVTIKTDSTDYLVTIPRHPDVSAMAIDFEMDSDIYLFLHSLASETTFEIFLIIDDLEDEIKKPLDSLYLKSTQFPRGILLTKLFNKVKKDKTLDQKKRDLIIAPSSDLTKPAKRFRTSYIKDLIGEKSGKIVAYWNYDSFSHWHPTNVELLTGFTLPTRDEYILAKKGVYKDVSKLNLGRFETSYISRNSIGEGGPSFFFPHSEGVVKGIKDIGRKLRNKPGVQMIGWLDYDSVAVMEMKDGQIVSKMPLERFLLSGCRIK